MKAIAASIVVASGAYLAASAHEAGLVAYFGLALCLIGVAFLAIFGILEKDGR